MKNYISYKNKSSEALLQKVEVTASVGGDSFVFFESHSYANRQMLKDHVEKALPELEELNLITIDGKNIFIARTSDSPEHLINKLQEHSGNVLKQVKEPKKEKKTDLIKLRGHVGVIGQLLMIGSAFQDGDKKSKAAKQGVSNYWETDDGQAKLKTSAYGFVGNGINSIYGVQKETDSTRLTYAKNIINKALGLRQGDDEKRIPKPFETDRKEKRKDEPSFMQKHSIRVGSAIKLFSKYQLTTGKGDDLKLSGWLSIAGKVISLTGLPEDPYQLEKKQDPLTQVRRRSNFTSSLLDWTSTFSLFAGSFYRKQDPTIKKAWYKLFDFNNSERRTMDNVQWWQLSGAVAFAIGLIIKAVAPYTEKTVDIDNLQSHATIAIASAVKENYVEELTQVTAQMMQTRELPEIKEQGFARTFTEIANRLEKHHDIGIHATNAPEIEPIQEQEVEIEHEVPKQRETKASPIAELARQKPKQKMTEHIKTAEANLSTSI